MLTSPGLIEINTESDRWVFSSARSTSLLAVVSPLRSAALRILKPGMLIPPESGNPEYPDSRFD
jgi:hypothetical protein